jgi:hypothetical protein
VIGISLFGNKSANRRWKVRTGVGGLGEFRIKDYGCFKILPEPLIKECLDSIFQDVLGRSASIPIIPCFKRKSLVLG